MKLLLLLSSLLAGCVVLQPTLFLDDRDRCWAVLRDTGELIQMPYHQCDKGWWK